MPKKNNKLNYWIEREKNNLTVELMKDEQVSKEMKRIIEHAMDICRKEIESFYTRYADKEGITVAEAKKAVDEYDVITHQNMAKQYVKNKDFSDKANERLRLYNVTMRINREELLLSALNTHLIAATNDIEHTMNDYLEDGAIREFKRQAGLLGNISVKQTDIHAIVNASYYDATWSERLWDNMDDVRKVVDASVKDTILRGRHPQESVKRLRELTGRSEYEARRLLISEVSRVQTEAKRLSYEEMDILEYKYLAIIDDRTTKTCKSLHGKTFKVSDMKVGVNAPPMHQFCRSTTVPTKRKEEMDWEDEEDGDLFIDDEQIEREADEENDDVLNELDNIMKRIDKLDNQKKKEVKKKVKTKTNAINNATRQQPEYNEKITDALDDDVFNKLTEQFNKGDERAVELFNRHTKDVNLLINKEKQTAAYHAGFKTVYLRTNDLQNDSFNVGREGYAISFFHEFGHAIDNTLGRILYKNKVTKKRPLLECDFTLFYKDPKSKMTLSETAREDFRNYREKIKEEHDLKSDSEVYKKIKEIYTDNEVISVVLEDLFDGASFGDLFIKYGHGKKYWKSKGIYGSKADMFGKEIFANLFSLIVCSPKELEYIRTIFPQTINMFYSMIDYAMGVESDEK